ncbi:MraY family glycosyltransferase [Desertivirga arenae]|uniref:MraY family glycosyltransferase n=1 Tax=Desertivirga arenae TaxID=2810309 RepID=UPI001A96CAB4|nr:glycosyltransferase family 4 protein [Pedobacter sp. SYSU D00823]
MSDLRASLSLLVVFFAIEILYFKIADKCNIIDTPNHRSSHTRITIRGGGIIFPIAVLLWFVQSGFQFQWFVLGLVLISTISFVDDITSLKSGVRSIFQFLAVGLLLYNLDLSIPFYYYPVLFIMIVGTKNAYNFMDGINGITGAYSLITLVSLLIVNQYHSQFTSNSLIISAILALLVFNFFNFRKKAKCFAGDVGSVSIAFIILFLIIQLIRETHNYAFVLLLMVYGLDTVTTILFRVIRRENILEAHRSHFYQFLANEKKIPHLFVSFLYAITQLIINLILIYLIRPVSFEQVPSLLVVIVLAGIIFIGLRLLIEGQERLIKKQVFEF